MTFRPPRLNNVTAFCVLASFGLASAASAAPLLLDATAPPPASVAAPYGPGTTKNPQGHEITADSRSFFLDGKPWIPVVGEFHYARYTPTEWRDELLKMKAGGIDTVSTYVFWIHHEEERGKWDWSGRRSLRDFIKAAQETGLKVIVRMGPWCHGEVRNGGFPDWVQNSGTHVREKDPAFLKLVEPLFAQEAEQMKGLLWKDGGPIIGVQLDNECDHADYLLALKQMARAAGVDVPLYTITGWQGGLPENDLIPLFGGYVDGFWGGDREGYRKEFLFNEVRAMNDLGAQLTNKNPSNRALIERFPYACAEIGGGMMSGYNRRLVIAPDDTAALALAKLGSGNNMPGYYMYHGGTNPDGKLSTLHEDHPNPLPTKNYDFQAPLGAAGQARAHYFLLREQHLFVQNFGAALARMSAFFPEKCPADLKDFDTLRWDVRSDGRSGFLFFSNRQPYEPLPEHRDVQFAVKLAGGTVLVPRQPITIPSGSYGILPVNLACDGVTLEYATAQLLCRVPAGKDTVFFLAALDGIAPELAVRGVNGPTRVQAVQPGTGVAFKATGTSGGTVALVVLTPEQGRQLSTVAFAGQERAILSRAVTVADNTGIRLDAGNRADLDLAMFPGAGPVNISRSPTAGGPDGIFSRYRAPVPLTAAPSVLTIKATLEKPAGPKATSLKGMEEATWNDAAVYKFDPPAAMANRRVLLSIDYTADAVRLYDGDRFLGDDFFNGNPFEIALWRIPPGDWSKLRLKVLPSSDGLDGRLPDAAKKKIAQAKKDSALDRITITAVDRFSLLVAPAAAAPARRGLVGDGAPRTGGTTP